MTISGQSKYLLAAGVAERGGEPMVPGQLDFWLWIVMVVTAVIGGILAVWGNALQRRNPGAGKVPGMGYRLTIASYGFMTASMLVFALRGFL